MGLAGQLKFLLYVYKCVCVYMCIMFACVCDMFGFMWIYVYYVCVYMCVVYMHVLLVCVFAMCMYLL